MIVAHGVEGLSIRAVADQIDYSPPALYRYFASKEDLVDAVRAQCFERLNAYLFQSIEKATNPPDQLFAGGMAYIAYACQYPADYHLMFQLAPSAATQAANHQTAMQALLYLVRSGILSGDFVVSDDYGEASIVYHCWATVHGLAMLQNTVMHDEQSHISALTESILRKVIAGFTRFG